MADLTVAKQTLKKKNLSLAIVKNGKLIFESRSSGVKSLLEAIDILGVELEGAAVADKIVGKAAALLCAYSKVNAVFASTLSLEGKKTLEKNRIRYEYEVLVPRILDKSGADICPFERFSVDLDSPAEAYVKLREFAAKMVEGGNVN